MHVLLYVCFIILLLYYYYIIILFLIIILSRYFIIKILKGIQINLKNNISSCDYCFSITIGARAPHKYSQLEYMQEAAPLLF